MSNNSNSTRDQQLQKIALDHLFIATLETRRSDSLDFHDVSVWSIKTALQAAFEAGRKAAANPSQTQPKQ